MRIRTLGVALILPALMAKAQPVLRFEDNQTLTYEEVIRSYTHLDSLYDQALLLELGATDSGRKLHLFLLSPANLNEGDMERWRESKVVLLVNNGIHPGESCGIDASLLWARQLLEKGVPDNLLIGIVPVYNIGGALNRGCCSRANQDGPEEHGFRGNARHLDLNRDFIKADALNTRSFYALFHYLKPHLFVDTHTSNGADYQYTMTLISTQKDKLNPVLADVLEKKMEPALYSAMEKKGWPMIPYVNVFGTTPDQGYAAFLETPRYASGYTALFNTIGFITETHMLKPYEDRVRSTLSFLEVLSAYAAKESGLILEARQQAEKYDRQMAYLSIQWVLDSTRKRTLNFKGYKASYEKSLVTTGQRLKYDREAPVNREIPYYDTYRSSDSARIPAYYVVPRAWREVPQLLLYNGVQMRPLSRDTSIAVESSYIKDYKFSSRPYEGHFPLQEVSMARQPQTRTFLKGDYLVPTAQPARRFIVSVLEPTAADSYLRWNFYDEIFQQKEYFSPYVYEETAGELLNTNPELRVKLQRWLQEDPRRASDTYGQLYYIFQQTEAYEKEHLRYPVGRIYHKKAP